MLRSYLRLLLFGFGLLAGVQVPALLDLHAQRVEAHRNEAQLALDGYRGTARQFFGGSLSELVSHYRASDDPVFRRDADNLQRLVDRAAALEAQWQAMQGPWYRRAWHFLFEADPDLRHETLAGFNYQVPLAPVAIAWGLSCGLLLAWLAECLLIGLAGLAPSGRRRHA